MIRRPPRSTLDRSSAASDVYKRQILGLGDPSCWFFILGQVTPAACSLYCQFLVLYIGVTRPHCLFFIMGSRNPSRLFFIMGSRNLSRFFFILGSREPSYLLYILSVSFPLSCYHVTLVLVLYAVARYIGIY